MPDDLVFCTPKGTPLNSKNPYNRSLTPACDQIKQPRVSWHSFRHTHATQLPESGESLKTAQTLLSHLDLETMIADSATRCRPSVRGFVSFSDVLESNPASHESKGTTKVVAVSYGE